MDYPFISKNNQPIVPGNNIYYHSRHHGEVFGEVVKCMLKRKYKWDTDPTTGRYRRIASEVVARVTVRVQPKPGPRAPHPYTYTTVVSPKSVMLVI